MSAVNGTERELVTLNEKPLIVAYRNTGIQTRALREHMSTKEHKITVTGQVCSGALRDHRVAIEFCDKRHQKRSVVVLPSMSYLV
jgi:hypothetical protein